MENALSTGPLLRSLSSYYLLPTSLETLRSTATFHRTQLCVLICGSPFPEKECQSPLNSGSGKKLIPFRIECWIMKEIRSLHITRSTWELGNDNFDIILCATSIRGVESFHILTHLFPTFARNQSLLAKRGAGKRGEGCCLLLVSLPPTSLNHSSLKLKLHTCFYRKRSNSKIHL